VPVRAKEIPKKVFEVFEKVDYMIHARDLVDLAVIDKLEQLAPFLRYMETWMDLKSAGGFRR